MADPDARPRLLLIEDDPALGPIVAGVLAEAWRVDLVADGLAGLDAARSGSHAVIVLDRRLPGMDGTEVVAALRREHVTTPVLMLTALGTTRDRVDGLDLGADDYLVKPVDFDELLARLRALTRSFAAEEAWLDIGAARLFPESRILVTPWSSRVVLSERENALLGELARRPDHTFPRADLLARVFPRGEQLGTVDTYVSYLRRKIDRDVVLTVRGRGYRIGTL
ncbi:two-component system response regulator QseB [Clavibacter michiganensis]|uniref:response regulator transcription factor n=1 Tax=Clavibacter michiganensis TaxID=28447 RepID=UPI001AE83A62|nr:response regulator transcription factor [Clavibacter michiganensis]MBP2457110.1 two-component system response regulator QseB [Clavibacter michiganensis]MDQ0409680.1 two-component system response regulator QseB [Clavibacter michiganensis]